MADTLQEAFASFGDLKQSKVSEVVSSSINEIFTINPDTRQIEVPLTERLFGVYNDKDVERKYFKCPQIVGDNVDLSKCYIFINYFSVGGNIGSYKCDDVTVRGNDIYFSWLLSGNVFDVNKTGNIYFAMCAKKQNPDGTMRNVFNTVKAIGYVSEGIEDIMTEVQERNIDLILQLLAEMDEVMKIATPEAMQEYVNTYFTDNLPVDSELKEDSIYPVQNKVITQEIQKSRESESRLSESIADISEDVNALNYEIFGKQKLSFKFQRGRYIQNGYNMERLVECVNDGYIEAGLYDFPKPPNGMDFSVFYYDSDRQGTLFYAWNDVERIGLRIERRAKINFRNTDITALSDDDLRMVESYKITKYNETSSPVFADGIPSDVLVGFYVPENSLLRTSTWNFNRVYVEADNYRVGLNINDDVVIKGENVTPDYYSDMLHTLSDNNGNVLAYYILHYIGTPYYTTKTHDHTELVYDSNANKKISEYLARKENLVLIGDSIFGNYGKNQLEPMLRRESDKQVFNCGFGGCMMSYRTENGSDPWDSLTFVSIADAVASGDFSRVRNAINLNNGYPPRYASLVSVDWTKPTTIIVDYVNNDITGNIALGNLWSDGQTESEWNKHTFLGAMLYGIKKIITRYPHIRFVFCTPVWRYMFEQDFWTYTNNIGIKASEYRDAIIENCKLTGISCFDLTTRSGRNPWNIEYLQEDASHWNEKGYERFAKLLNAVDKSDLG